MDRYEVTLLDRFTGNKWTMMFDADDFAHAEEQAIDGAGSNPDEIISIVKDYDA